MMRKQTMIARALERPKERPGFGFAEGLRTDEGFTLLELMVVIGLFCLLGITLAPVLAKSRSNSLSLQCLNNNRRLCAAWHMYADDSRDWVVYASTGGNNLANNYAWTWSHMDCRVGNSYNWDTNSDIVLRPLWPYTGLDASIYRCPADKSYAIDLNGNRRLRVRSFSMNAYLGGYGGTCDMVLCPYRVFLKTTDLTAPGPAKTFVFIEERPEAINWGDFYTDMAGYPSSPGSYTLDLDFPGVTHDLACSLSFGDGHTELHRWRDPRTAPALFCAQLSTLPVPFDQDVAWLQDRATRRQ